MNILLAFIPFIAFAILEGRLGIQSALLVATIAAAALVARDWLFRRRSLKLLEVGSLLLFATLALASHSPKFHPSILMVRLLVDSGLLLVVGSSVAAGRPFTLQYAKERVSDDVAVSAPFKRLNVILSLGWTIAFAVMVASDFAMLYLKGFTPVFGAVVILAAVAAAAVMTAWLPRTWPRQTGNTAD
jgi:intracellular septation protein A